MILKDLISPFYIWKRAFAKPYTSMKPIDERPGAPRYRGFHINDMEKCIGCGSCEDICQNAAIDLVPVDGIETTMGDSGLRPKIDYGRCCWCALCVDICTTESLSMTNEYIWVSSDADSFRFIPGDGKKPWNGEEWADDDGMGYKRDPDYQLLHLESSGMEILDGDTGVKSFEEVVKGYSAEQAIAEASRCVDCGICVATCPAHMDIPLYIAAIREGDFEKGMRLLYNTNPFSNSCGRICTHRCEEVCSIGYLGEPVAIRWLKRYIMDQIPADKYRDVLKDEFEPNGRKIAIIGAGPGGMSAAYYLIKMGYDVTIFEMKEKAGGMLRYGVPSYRLPYEDLDKDCDYIESLGVKINYSTKVGKDIQFQELMDGYEAIFFSTGLDQPSSLRVEGEDHSRVLSGLKVLDDVTYGRDPGVGKKVAVIGGGNVAMDAARVSRRQGAEVTILYRRRIQEMPAAEEEIHESQAEKVIMKTQAIPVRIENADDPNQVQIVWGEAKMVADDKGGRARPVLQEDKMHTEVYDSIISAIGQAADYSFLPKEYEDQIEFKWGKVITNELKQTTVDKIFVGGDIGNETADAISAIDDGHQAARGIDQLLNKK